MNKASWIFCLATMGALGGCVQVQVRPMDTHEGVAIPEGQYNPCGDMGRPWFLLVRYQMVGAPDMERAGRDLERTAQRQGFARIATTCAWRQDQGRTLVVMGQPE